MLTKFVRERFPKWAMILLTLFGGASIIYRLLLFIDDCIDKKEHKNVEALVWSIVLTFLLPITLIVMIKDLIDVCKNREISQPDRTGRYHNRTKRRRSENIFVICLLAYPILQWAIFWLYPNLKTFAFPFLEWSYMDSEYKVNGFQNDLSFFYNFEKLIKGFFDPGTGSDHSILWNAFFNTFHSLWINLILLPLAVVIGYALSKHVPGEKFFRVIFFIPNIISTVVMCFIFRFMFESNEALFTGPAAKLLQALGSSFNGWDLTNSSQIWTLVYVYCIWTGLSINVVLISSAYQRIPKEIIESARLDGVTFFQEFYKISLPLIMPTVSTFLINSFIAVTAFYLQPYMLIGTTEDGGTFLTIPWMIFNYMTSSPDQNAYILAATIGILFSAIMFPLIMFARWVGKKLTPDVEF